MLYLTYPSCNIRFVIILIMHGRTTSGRSTSQIRKSLIIKLGLVICESKLYEQQKCIPCLGINVNIETGIISIPEEKLAEIVTLCLDWSTRGKSNKKALQSLVGSLLYIPKCVRPARLFVNQILATLRQTPNKGTITLSPEFI